MKTLLPILIAFCSLSAFSQTSSRPLRFYESIAAMVANRPITNEVLAITQRSGTNAGPLLFFWHAPTAAPTNTVDTFNAPGGGQYRLITNVVTVAIPDGSITTNKWDSVAHQWVSGKQDYSSILSGLTNLTFATGDLIYWNGSAFARVPLGTNGQALTVGTNAVYYATPSTGTGNVRTNQDNTFIAGFTQTFNGTLLLGTTNLATALAQKQDALSFSTGTTNSAGTVKIAISAGANIQFSTNAQTITITLTDPVTISNLVASGTLQADTLLLTTPGGLASGMTGGSNVVTAQASLQLTPGVYTQAYNAYLAQLAGLSLVSGDLLYYDGSQLQRLAKQTNGQVLTLASGFPAWRDAASSTNGTTNATTIAQLSDVNINTNQFRRYDTIGWNGTDKWIKIPAQSRFGNANRYEEWYSGCTTTSSQSPYASAVINSGSGNAYAGSIFGRSGYIRCTTASSSAALNTGSSWMTSVTHLFATNELYFHTEVRGAQTNGVAGRIGFFDQNSTNVFTQAFGFTVTNNVWKLIAGFNSNFTLSTNQFVPDTNVWHNVDICLTNQVGSVQVYTNGVLAYSEAMTSTNIPSNVTLGCGVNFFGIAAASTNGQDLIFINDIGHRYSKY